VKKGTSNNKNIIVENKPTILYFLSHPIQYFSPLLETLAKKMELKVYYYSEGNTAASVDKGFGKSIQWDVPLLKGYHYEFLKNYSGSRSLDNHLLDVFNPGIFKALRKEKAPVVIVNGWTYSSTLLVIFFSKLLGKKLWLRAENPLNQELKKGSVLLFVKRIFLKHILFKFFVSRCLYIGTESKGFFEYYGVGASRLVYTPYSVNNDFFVEKYQELKPILPQLKKQLGLPVDKMLILYVGKYIDKKRPLDLMRAFEKLNHPQAALVMVGEGPLRASMEEYIKQHNLAEVYLTGFINQSQISDYYAAADVFVMCSGAGETWGLTVNEAMNFEKPIIVSKTCGSATDLVREGENGFSFEEGDIESLTGYLEKMMSDHPFRQAAGKKSGEIIKDFNIDINVSNIITALAK
jgi:glycosyltransferase involved in cell wall biosynthesis